MKMLFRKKNMRNTMIKMTNIINKKENNQKTAIMVLKIQTNLAKINVSIIKIKTKDILQKRPTIPKGKYFQIVLNYKNLVFLKY